jgi:hypothetical protein
MPVGIVHGIGVWLGEVVTQTPAMAAEFGQGQV